MFKAIGSVFSFLTILPSNNASLDTVAKYMYLFPIVGIVIGISAGGLGFVLSEIGLEPLIVSLFLVSFIVIITGVHHLDGLSDFADGLMVQGSKEKKLAAMKDVTTGSAGTTSIVLYLVAMISALSLTSGFEMIYILITSEVIAKFSMVLMSSTSRCATAGSSSVFIKTMKDKKRLGISFVITILVVIFIGNEFGLIAFGVSIALTFFLIAISTRSFGGITGDILGATNELTRLLSILVFVL